MSLPSYPYDGGARFVARAVGGIVINRRTIESSGRAGQTSGREGFVWYVLDRAYCHRPVERRGTLARVKRG